MQPQHTSQSSNTDQIILTDISDKFTELSKLTFGLLKMDELKNLEIIKLTENTDLEIAELKTEIVRALLKYGNLKEFIESDDNTIVDTPNETENTSRIYICEKVVDNSPIILTHPRQITSAENVNSWVEDNLPNDGESTIRYLDRYNHENPDHKLTLARFGSANRKMLEDIGYKTTRRSIGKVKTTVWKAPQRQIYDHQRLPVVVPTQHIDRPNYVYFMADDDGYMDEATETIPIIEVKIGRSVNPHVRLQTLRCARPRLQLITTIACDADRVERDLHKIHADRRIKGEWFHFTRAELNDAVNNAWIMIAGEDELS